MSIRQPLRNNQGEVVPHDHEDIRNEDGVIRRISELQLVFDEKIGCRRISSLAFNMSSGLNGGMSIDLQRLIEEDGLDARHFVTTPQWTGSVRFEAGQLRAEDLQVGFDPLPNNPYHGEVWGNITRSKQKRLRQLCSWFVPIKGVLIDG